MTQDSREGIPLFKVAELNIPWALLEEGNDDNHQTVLEWLNEWEEDFGMEPSTQEYWKTQGDQALSEHINFIDYLANK